MATLGPRAHRALAAWLQAEAALRAEEADRGLSELFAALPRPAVPAGFAERVMARAGLAPRPDLLARRWARWTLGAAAGLSAAASVFLLPAVRALVGLVSPADLVSAGSRATIGVVRWLAEGLSLWQALAAVGEALAHVAGQPAVLAAAAASVLASAGGLRALQRLLAAERSNPSW